MPLDAASLAIRSRLITSTDAAAICAVHPWRTIHDVYADKVAPTERPSTLRQRKGNALEPLGIELLAEYLAPQGLAVVATGATTLVHPILDWLGATPDAAIYQPRDEVTGPSGIRINLLGSPVAGGEVKTVGLGTVRDWDGPDGEPVIPDYYAIQVAVQLAVLRVPVVHLVAILDTEDVPRHYAVERDGDLEAEILEACDDFRRRYLIPRIPPPVDASDNARAMLRSIYRAERTTHLIRATPEVEELARAYFAAKRERDAADERRKLAENRIAALIGDGAGFEGDGWRVRWTTVAESTIPATTRSAYRRFDLRAVKGFV